MTTKIFDNNGVVNLGSIEIYEIVTGYIIKGLVRYEHIEAVAPYVVHLNCNASTGSSRQGEPTVVRITTIIGER